MARVCVEGTRSAAATPSPLGPAIGIALALAAVAAVLALWQREGAAIFLDMLLSGIVTCL